MGVVGGNGNVRVDPDIKPIEGYVIPPTSTIISLVCFICTSIYYFPTISTSSSSEEEDGDNISTLNMFTTRVYPTVISVRTLLCIRLFFAFIGFVGFISAWYTPTVTIHTPYLATSRVPRIPFELTHFKKAYYPFTCWSWNILTIHYMLNCYMIYTSIIYGDAASSKVPTIIQTLAIVTWEISAPMTLLIGVVVKYALWPARMKEAGTGDIFMKPRALLTHNANVIMVMIDVCFVGGCGIPFELSHFPIVVLYGCSYVLFTYAIQLTWHENNKKQRYPAFLYFFMDPTIGYKHTIALYILLFVLTFFYILFVGIEELLQGHYHITFFFRTIYGRIIFGFTICCFVCRFRD